MLDMIRSAFPDHHVYAEESGDHGGDGDYRWIVDPLDGTNNFEAGLPAVATAASVLHGGEPALAVASVPMLDDRYVARIGPRSPSRSTGRSSRPASGASRRGAQWSTGGCWSAENWTAS